MAVWARPLPRAPEGAQVTITPQGWDPPQRGGPAGRICLSRPPTGLEAHPARTRGLPSCVTPSLVAGASGAGMLTGCPSPTPFGLGLGPPNPRWTSLPWEALGFRREGFSPSLSLLVPAFSLLLGPPALSVGLQPQQNAPLPTPGAYPFGGRVPEGTHLPWGSPERSAASAAGLSPVTFSAPGRSTGQLLRTV